MKIAIATQSPPKVSAIKEAVSSCKYFEGNTVEYITRKTDSGISDMPTSMAENMLGAKNRAQNIAKEVEADFYIGMEGGMDFIGEKSYLFGVVYILDSA